jgi:hypothetical protein
VSPLQWCRAAGGQDEAWENWLGTHRAATGSASLPRHIGAFVRRLGSSAEPSSAVAGNTSNSRSSRQANCLAHLRDPSRRHRRYWCRVHCRRYALVRDSSAASFSRHDPPACRPCRAAQYRRGRMVVVASSPESTRPAVHTPSRFRPGRSAASKPAGTHAEAKVPPPYRGRRIIA